MTCRDSLNLLPLFFDGELDARQMRSVALHSSRCPTCETELRNLEHLQELVGAAISSRVDELDLSNLWSAIEPRLASSRRGWWRRTRDWWQEFEAGWAIRIPAVGVAVAIAILAVLFFTRLREPVATPELPQLAENSDNRATIDSLGSDYDSVGVVDNGGTTIIWVSGESSAGSRE